MRLYGGYRTRRLVLDAWHRLEMQAPADAPSSSLPVKEPC